MSSSNTIQLNGETIKSGAKCHLIPCKIKANGNANVDQYFVPTIRESDTNKNVLLSSFRGRPLIGQKVNLPDNCNGFIIEKSADSCLTGIKSFKDLTYWNWDQMPSDSDPIPRAFQWISISKAIHESVSPTNQL